VGYSASVACQSIKARDKLATFLKEHMVPWSSLVQNTKSLEIDPAYDYTRYVQVADELSYCHGNSRVGFNFSTQYEPGWYMWAILRWSALRVGRFAWMEISKGEHGMTRYTTYDGYDHDPVLPKSFFKHPKYDRWTVDKHGCRPIPRPWAAPTKTLSGKAMRGLWYLLEEKRTKQKEKIIEEAMIDLSKKWKP
jgi:hypothetical protein